MIPGVVAAGNRTFDPISALPWSHLMWADDPNWTKPANNDPVDTWRNAIAPANSPTASSTARPTFLANSSSTNGKNALDFDGSDDMMYNDITNLVQGYTFVVIFRSDSTTLTRRLMGTDNNNARGIGAQSNGAYRLNGAAAIDSVTGLADTTGVHLLTGRVSSTVGTLYLDGVLVASGNSGNAACEAIVLGCGTATGGTSPANFFDGKMCLAGLIPNASGAITGLTNYEAFKEWAKVYYNITGMV